MSSLTSSSLKQLLHQLRSGQISAKNLCEKCLRRGERLRELNVFITETPDTARAQAEQADKKLVSGKNCRAMEGIPIAVKDNFSTKGIQTTCASRMLQGYVPPYDATVVKKLTSQGAVMVGKTNLDEFAMGCGSVDSLYGPVRNPWLYDYEKMKKWQQDASGNTSATSDKGHDWYIAGGSSGGSAVAVATGIAFGALGSDTGGSTRNPASYCGIVGFKPTYGLLSRHGLIPLVNSLDVPGILTKTVDDAVIMLNVLAGHDALDSTTVKHPYTPFTLPDDISVKGLHIGIPIEYHAPGLTKDVLAAWERTADMLESAGAKVTQVSMPYTQYSIVCYSVLCACEVASNMARYDGIEYGHRAQVEHSTEELYAASRHEGFNDVVRGRILAGNYFLLKRNYDRYFLQAQRVRRLISQDFDKVYASGVDLLLTPTVLSEAPRFDWFSTADNRTQTQEQDVFTQPANLAGVPAVTIPTVLSSNGLPIGLQLLGQRFQERKLLEAAKWLEQQNKFTSLNLDWLDH